VRTVRTVYKPHSLSSYRNPASLVLGVGVGGGRCLWVLSALDFSVVEKKVCERQRFDDGSFAD